jgi:hypothetical protein
VTFNCKRLEAYNMGVQHILAEPHQLLWAALQATCVEITLNGIPNLLNGCVIFILSK